MGNTNTKKTLFRYFILYMWLFPAALLLGFFLIFPAMQTVLMSFQQKIKIEESTIRQELSETLVDYYGKEPAANHNLSELEDWHTAIAPLALKYSVSITRDDVDELTQVRDLSEILVSAIAERDREKGGIKKYSFINYKNLFSDKEMHKAFRNNIIWLLCFTFFTVVTGLALATMVDKVRWSGLIKAVVFIPMAISFVASGIIWKFMYEKSIDIGTINAIMNTLSKLLVFKYEPIAFLGRAETVNAALIFAGVWMWVGFCMVIFLAALKGIPEEVREASSLEGVTPLQLFMHVEVPMILPTIVVVTTTMIINVLKVFDIVYVMTGGGPYGAESEVLANRMYRTAFNFGNFEYAAAMAVILLLAVIPIMITNIKSFISETSSK